MGDVISMGTKQVVQMGDDKPPLAPVETTGSDLIWGDEEIEAFLALVGELNFAYTRADQMVVMTAVKRIVQGWPDG